VQLTPRFAIYLDIAVRHLVKTNPQRSHDLRYKAAEETSSIKRASVAALNGFPRLSFADR
jgi:hypothetical protein